MESLRHESNNVTLCNFPFRIFINSLPWQSSTLCSFFQLNSQQKAVIDEIRIVLTANDACFLLSNKDTPILQRYKQQWLSNSVSYNYHIPSIKISGQSSTHITEQEHNIKWYTTPKYSKMLAPKRLLIESKKWSYFNAITFCYSLFIYLFIYSNKLSFDSYLSRAKTRLPNARLRQWHYFEESYF